MPFGISRFDLRHIQYIVDEVQKVLTVLLNEAQIVIHIFGQFTVQAFEHHVGKAEDGIQWRAQLM